MHGLDSVSECSRIGFHLSQLTFSLIVPKVYESTRIHNFVAGCMYHHLLHTRMFGGSYAMPSRIRCDSNRHSDQLRATCNVIIVPGHAQETKRPLPGCIVMSDGRFQLSTEQQHEAFANRSVGEELEFWEAARVANSFYARQHGCGRVGVETARTV